MLTEHHCHILPKIDDGAESVETSISMLKMLREQGVERIVATPHFYAHKEKNVTEYLAKRQKSFDKLVKSDSSAADILLGAEVAVEHGLSELADIQKLRIADTNYILLELPYTSFSHWTLEEVNNIACEYGLTPILAHVHRYIHFYSKSEMQEVLSTDAVFQINIEAFRSFKERRFVKSLIKENRPYLFGSDSHNLSDRKPNWDVLKRKAKSDIIDGVMDIWK